MITQPEIPDPAFEAMKANTKQNSKVQLKYLIRAMVKYNASDLHIKANRSPLYRINGRLIPAKLPELVPEQVKSILYSLLSKKQARELEEKRQIDFSFEVKGVGRIRCNVYFQRDTVSAALRMIPMKIASLDELHIPPVIKELCEIQRGLLLITGASGSGKSTTLAAIVKHLNENNSLHILTLEDPIEFSFQDERSSIAQREVGSDVLSMKDALRAGLRQDPDVIVIGEMRDFETIQAALTAAETGHLVVSTLHTNDAKSTVDRILDVFPAEAQNQVRIQLASSLIGVISQQLLTRADGVGLVPACEILINSPSIQECIRKNERGGIPEMIENSSHYYKMQSMNLALEKLVSQGIITSEEALKSSNNSADLRLRLTGVMHNETVPILSLTKKIV